MAECSCRIYFIDSVVPVGSLTPTHIRVTVLLTDCSGGNVIVRTDHTGQSPATPVPPSGATIELAVTRPTQCDEPIFVEAWCEQDPKCRDGRDYVVPCTQCVRAHLSYAAGQCTGTPPVQPITVKAEIGLAAGQSTTFRFDYGDGTVSAPFSFANPQSGSAATVYTWVDPAGPHNYTQGNWAAKLEVIPPPSECGPFPLPITVICPPSCPTASNATWADKGCVVVSGQGKKRRIELSVTVAPTSVGSAAQWILRKKLPGGTLGAPITLTFGFPGGPPAGPAQQVPPGPQSVDLDSGDYEASLQFVYPYQTCPGITLNITASPCPPDCPDLQLSPPIVTECAPVNAVASFNATLSWLAAQAQVPVDYYLWTVEWLDQSVSPPVQRKAENSTPGPTLTPSIKTNSPGWTGNGAVGGQVDLSKPGSYTVSVQAIVNGVSPTLGCNAFQSSVPPFQVPPCTCPRPLSAGTEWTVTGTTAPLGPNKFQTLACDTAATQLTVHVDPGSYPTGSLTYDWSFPDGTTIVGGGATRSFTFRNAQPGTAQTHTLTVTVRVPGSACAPFIRTVEVTVPGCTGAAPTVSGCSVKSGARGTGSISVTFDQAVDRASAENPNNYRVSISNGPAVTPTAGSIAYDPATKTATISGLTINPGDSVVVTVTGVQGATGAVMTTPGQANCSAPKPPDDSGGSPSLCGILLWVAIALMAVGAILAIVGCILAHWYPQAGAILQIIGVIVFVVGWILFAIWLLFCRLTTACEVILAVRSVIGWLIVVFGVIAVALTAIGVFYPAFLLCAAYSWGSTANWGLVYKLVDDVAEARRCLIQNSSG
jgi:hypothetical protein